MPQALLRIARAAAALLAIASIAVLPSAASADADCFRREDSQRLSFDIFQMSAPPRYAPAVGDYVEASPWYPATDYVTTTATAGGPARSAAGLRFRSHYLLWANRCIFLPDTTPAAAACRNTTRIKGNGYPGMRVDRRLPEQLRIVHSTYRRADGCTMLAAMRLLGDSAATIEETAHAAGLSVLVRGADQSRLASLARQVRAGSGRQAATGTYLVDTCVIEPSPMASSASGIVLDYEVFDSRSPAEALTFFRELSDLVRRHGKSLIVATNPLPREQNGILASNVRDVLGLIDGIALPISSGATPGNPDIELSGQKRQHSPLDSYRTQLAVLNGQGQHPLAPAERRKIIWNVSLHDTSLAEAAALREEVLQHGYRGLMLFRNYTRQGGNCAREPNQVTACLALGQCGGGFGGDR